MPTLQGVVLFGLFLILSWLGWPQWWQDPRFLAFVLASGVIVA